MAFAGVELPESLGQEPSAPSAPAVESAPASPEGASPEGQKSLDTQTSTETNQAAQSILDLDKLERVRWDGKEWSRKELREAMLRREDYSRKTAELAKSREEIDRGRQYSANFAADLRLVLRNPNRLEEFRKIYPKEYVDAAMDILESRGPGQESQPKSDVKPEAYRPDPRIDEIYSKFQTLEQREQQAAVEKFETWLDGQVENLSKKYEFADREAVLARAQVISDQGNELTDKVLERLFKEHNSEVKSRWEKHYQAVNTKQLKAGEAGKDVGSGGGIPGQAPNKPKTMKDARAFIDSKY